VLSERYLATSALARFEQDRRPEADRPLLDWCCESALYAIQQSLHATLTNFPIRPVGWILRRIVFPFGLHRRPPSDRLGQQCAELLLQPSETRDRLTDGIFIGKRRDDITGRLEYALDRVLAAEPVERKLRDGGFKSPRAAVEAGAITAADAALLDETAAAVRAAIMVDDFAPEELFKGAGQSPEQQTVVALSI